METKRICRLLIAIFVLLSIMFYVLYSKEYKIKNTLSEFFIDDTILNLEQNGVDISRDIIKTTIPTMDIYLVSYEDLSKHNELVADIIIKNAYSESTTTTKFEVPDGYSIGVYDKNDSSRELGRVVFYDGDMSFKFTSNGINISGVSDPVVNGNVLDVNENTLSIIESITQKLTFDYDIEYELSGSSVDDDTEIVTVIQKIDDYEILDAYINFVFYKQKLIMASGKIITGSPERKYNESIIDGINVLYKINLENVSEILEEKLVYSHKKTDNEKYYLVPVWKITYADLNGSIITQFVDTL